MGVVIDTSEWLQAFNVANSPERAEVDRLIESEEAVLVGIVYAEILRGARDEHEFRLLEERLSALDYLEASKETWAQVGRLLFELRRRGETIPLADALIATLAREGNHEVYSRDAHFKKVPGLRIHEAK